MLSSISNFSVLQNARICLTSIKPLASRLFERIFSCFSLSGSLKNHKIAVGLLLLPVVLLIYRRCFAVPAPQNPGYFSINKEKYDTWLNSKGINCENMYEPLSENIIEDLDLPLETTYKDTGHSEDYNYLYPEVSLREVATELIRFLNHGLAANKRQASKIELTEEQMSIDDFYFRWSEERYITSRNFNSPHSKYKISKLHNTDKTWLPLILNALKEKRHIFDYPPCFNDLNQLAVFC